MQRADLVSLFAELRTGEPVIVGPGTTSGALYQVDHRAPTIYNMDMGYATAICLGLALAVPTERVVALEGDGSALAGLGVLSTIGRYAPPNLVVVVFHNGVYASCGDGLVPTAAAATTDLAAVAPACGIRPQNVVAVRDARRGAQGSQRRTDRAGAVGRRGPDRAAGSLAGRPATAAS